MHSNWTKEKPKSLLIHVGRRRWQAAVNSNSHSDCNCISSIWVWLEKLRCIMRTSLCWRSIALINTVCACRFQVIMTKNYVFIEIFPGKKQYLMPFLVAVVTAVFITTHAHTCGYKHFNLTSEYFYDGAKLTKIFL